MHRNHLTSLTAQSADIHQQGIVTVRTAMVGVHRKIPFDQWNTTRS